MQLLCPSGFSSLWDQRPAASLFPTPRFVVSFACCGHFSIASIPGLVSLCWWPVGGINPPGWKVGCSQKLGRISMAWTAGKGVVSVEEGEEAKKGDTAVISILEDVGEGALGRAEIPWTALHSWISSLRICGCGWMFFVCLRKGAPALVSPAPAPRFHPASFPWRNFLAMLCLGMQGLPWSGLILAFPEPQNLGMHQPTWGLLLG